MTNARFRVIALLIALAVIAVAAKAGVFAVMWETFSDGSCRFRSLYVFDNGGRCVTPWRDHFCPSYPCMALDAPDSSTIPLCDDEGGVGPGGEEDIRNP